jgi:hypothetical protein
MKIDQDDYIIGIWFGELNGVHNVMSTVKRSKEPGYDWFGEARLRMFNDDKIDDSTDTKSFWELRIKDQTEEQVIAKMNELFTAMKEKNFVDYYEYIPVNGDGEKFMFIVAMQPWSHIKRERL